MSDPKTAQSIRDGRRAIVDERRRSEMMRFVKNKDGSFVSSDASAEATQIGPRGGKYIIGKNGKKYYPVKGSK